MSNNWTSIDKYEDPNQSVIKFVFTKEDAVAEAVLYRYPTYDIRTVICCSTQSGCPVGCRFCGAGDHFVRSLTSDEIVDQVRHCIEMTELDSRDISKLQIMFMSMGEPFLNKKSLNETITALNRLYPNAALLVSTTAPQVDYDDFIELSCEIETIGLQFSIHETTDELRDRLIPFKKKLSLTQIADLGTKWHRKTGRRPFINYCAHEHNSFTEDAERLATIFDPSIFEATVSVICERNSGMPASNDVQRSLAVDFAGKLVEIGFNVRVFDPAGQDTIGGGCGQLWFIQDWLEQNKDRAKPSVGCGKPIVHVPV